MSGVRGDLVSEVRCLLDEVAATDPDRAAVRFNALVAEHGRIEVGAALIMVAPHELAELLGVRGGPTT